MGLGKVCIFTNGNILLDSLLSRFLKMNCLFYLSKSLQAIGLLLSNPPKAIDPKTTLIVCPLSVISNWVEQIEQHLVPNTLKVGIYHGTHCRSLLTELSDLDVLISPYGTISADYCIAFPNGLKGDGAKEDLPPQKKKTKHTTNGMATVFDNIFHRIILDEAHTIRNSKSKAYAGCMALQSTYRLCLTGTPLQNKPEDIHSLLSFLAVEPLADRTIFRRAIAQPIGIGDPVGLSRLRTVMAHVALRRNKSKLDLVSKTVELRSIRFPDSCAHKRIHDALFESTQIFFRATLSSGDDKQLSKYYMKILELLTRIRQACISGNLVPKRIIEAAEQVLELVKDQELSPEDGEKLLEKLKGTFSETTECAICLDTMEEDEAVILRECSHIFCESCLYKVSEQCREICPLCRCRFKPTDILTSSRDIASAMNGMKPATLLETMSNLSPSPKLKALALAIGEMHDDEKGVIFSQFTKMLDLLEAFLKEQGHSFVRIDGSKSAAQRSTAMKQFSTENGGPRFILCSLHAAGTGITLTRGNHCFMMDTWWNSSVEQQAMDRVSEANTDNGRRKIFCF
jgi:SNF2 family DNA or RNA helicase